MPTSLKTRLCCSSESGLILILHQVAIGTRFRPLPFLHRLGRGGVFAQFDGDEVGRVHLGNSGVNLHRLFGVAHLDVEIAELVHQLGVLGASLDERLEGERGDGQEVGRFGGVLEHVVLRLFELYGSCFEGLFGDFHRRHGILLDHAAGFEAGGREAGEKALLAFGRGNLRFAQDSAAVEKTGHFLSTALISGEMAYP